MTYTGSFPSPWASLSDLQNMTYYIWPTFGHMPTPVARVGESVLKEESQEDSGAIWIPY